MHDSHLDRIIERVKVNEEKNRIDYDYDDNKVATVLFIIGVVEMAVGLICGIAFAKQPIPGFEFETEFSMSVFIAWTIAGFVSGMLFIAGSEIIKLLQKNIIRTEIQTIYVKQLADKMNQAEKEAASTEE